MDNLKETNLDISDLKQLLISLLTLEEYYKCNGYKDDSLLIKIFHESYNKLSKLDNARICIENELMKSKNNLPITYALQFALDEIRKVIN